MIGSLFKELPPVSKTEAEDNETSENLSYPADSDDSLLASLPVVQKIVRRKFVLSLQSETSDLVQSIAIRLLGWRDKHREKSAEMSSDEWESFAAQTAYNEINRHFLKTKTNAAVPIETAENILSPETLEGASNAEVFSLARIIWQEICSMSLRQRRALLLGSHEIVINFLACGITDQELAEVLSMSMEEWAEAKEKLPLKNFQIAELIIKEGSEKSLESIINSIKKARHHARGKLRRLTDK